jgi:L-seryl-tRNA(Ser) seleniumtransferase
VGDFHRHLRALPSIDALLALPESRACAAPRWAVVEALRRAVDDRRAAILAGRCTNAEIDIAAALQVSFELCQPGLRRVINATGVVLHTNLGRAPLAGAALAAVLETGGYCNLEYNLDAGARGSRHGHLAGLVSELFGAEDAVVVNNNAAAVLLGLAALASEREVIVSRGELVEIGGSFRIPDVMRMSGATLVEVGTTNKTRLSDYEGAISSDTGLLLKVHRSNFAMVGFTAEVSLEELCSLAGARGLAAMIDLGSGALLEAQAFQVLGLPVEPNVRAAVRAGADLVAFSADKLLGGPQAGVLAGTRAAVAAARSHPLMRALRPDKLSLAALVATLALYRDGRALRDIPALAMLALPAAELKRRAEAICEMVHPTHGTLCVCPTESTVGGGSMPTASLPSFGVAIDGVDAREADVALRRARVPVVSRIREDRVILDLRTVQPEEVYELAAAIAGVGAIP